MRRTRTAVGIALSIMLAPSLAHAQAKERFGQQGQFIIGVDRLFSLFSFTHISQNAFPTGAGVSQRDVWYNQTNFSLLWSTTSAGSLALPGSETNTAAAPINTFFTIPRVGFDYVLVPHVTIGGELMLYFTLGGSAGSDSTNNQGVTTTNSAASATTTAFGIAPRGGYILDLSDLFSVWLRGGFSYYIATAKNPDGSGDNANQLALDLDPQFVLTAIPHVGFTAGPTLDIPLTGGHASWPANGVTTSASSSIVFFGITLGMLAYF